MKKYQILFILLWAVVLLWIILQEADLLPQAFLPNSPVARYTCDLLSAATAIIGTYLACKLFAFEKIKKQLADEEEDNAHEAQKKWNGMRLLILAIAILPSAFIYYAQAFSQTALFCMLIALTGSLFCWPYEKTKTEN